MRFAVLVLSFSGALSQCASYYNNVMSACDLANSGNEATRFCSGACNTALNTASNGCSASVPDEAQAKQNADQMLSYCSGSSACIPSYTSMQAECDLANPGNEDTTRFCNGACNAALNTVSNGCSASVTDGAPVSEAQAKQNADMMLSYCSGSSACIPSYMSMQAECDLANFDGTDTTRFCNGACNAALNTVSNSCSASVTDGVPSEAEAKQNADMMLSNCVHCPPGCMEPGRRRRRLLFGALPVDCPPPCVPM